jgi:hypothetical protein
VQFHHKDAWGKHHATAAVETTMLTRVFHNLLAARRDYGDARMDRFTRLPSRG